MQETSPQKLDTVKVNARLKAKAEVVFEQIGMNASEAINIFFAQVANSRGLPFKPQMEDDLDEMEYLPGIEEQDFYCATKEEVDAKLKEAEEELASGAELLDGFAVFEEFRKELSGKYGK
ncbi:MAG: type II toxin-antitoxin system RelB/DinJ family antitoxin [Clostridiales bacterium]|jgi:addiction module RelB/DinJ family antitoxin|nr:type II toxin-antitoxin system RelB/DinJ family antitoxin [Clostridiales bacterium]